MIYEVYMSENESDAPSLYFTEDLAKAERIRAFLEDQIENNEEEKNPFVTYRCDHSEPWGVYVVPFEPNSHAEEWSSTLDVYYPHGVDSMCTDEEIQKAREWFAAMLDLSTPKFP